MSPWTVCVNALAAVAVIMALLVLALPENPLRPADNRAAFVSPTLP
jgi:hypothetical protein